ncbi:hypothetical protein ACFOOM_12065 [Streptomyces echinoruber]|uniref:Glycine-rich domain-containing protein n=1 Tax=Streptomyces echinoruber TaxID=68898 RepID=A0A918RJU2_9ACTN|nr:hypothetical protein [Streptomyces echinoruber]GHA01573.1 hypothetical protein GCM10010389_46190 [Streptomyces echinoruber]
MSQTTGKGLIYPESNDHARIWEWLQSLATSADAAIPGSVDVQVFTSSGTWTRPAGALWVEVHVQAAGGGSGGVASTGSGQAACAPGGGGGEYARGFFTAAAAGASQSITVGVGGAGGAAGANSGANGGNSSFGALITAMGGSGAQGATATSAASLGGANGGTGGTGGNFRIPGGDGGNGQVIASVPVKYNNGGGAFLGGMRRSSGVAATTTTGFDGYPYGGGASGPANGATQAAVAGSKGADGVVIVITYKA